MEAMKSGRSFQKQTARGSAYDLNALVLPYMRMKLNRLCNLHEKEQVV